MEAVSVTGPDTANWGATYQTTPSTFTYTHPATDAAVSTQVRTFASATFELRVPDYQGGFTTVQKNGILMQTSNGDVFFRPAASTVQE